MQNHAEQIFLAGEIHIKYDFRQSIKLTSCIHWQLFKDIVGINILTEFEIVSFFIQHFAHSDFLFDYPYHPLPPKTKSVSQPKHYIEFIVACLLFNLYIIYLPQDTNFMTMSNLKAPIVKVCFGKTQFKSKTLPYIRSNYFCKLI